MSLHKSLICDQILESWDTCGVNWTLFLCEHFLLFQLICLPSGHASENSLLSLSLGKVLGKQWKPKSCPTLFCSVTTKSGQEPFRFVENSFRLMAFRTLFLFILYGEYELHLAFHDCFLLFLAFENVSTALKELRPAKLPAYAARFMLFGYRLLSPN